MRHSLLALTLALSSATLPAQTAPVMTGTWVITLEYLNGRVYWNLHLTESNGKLAGDLDGDKLEGSRTGNHISFHAVDPRGGSEDVVDATLDGNTLSGNLKWWEVGSPKNYAAAHPFTATLQNAKPYGPPQRHEFVPTEFHNQFSGSIPPVLHLQPGDSLHTTTVDAGGYDEQNVHRSIGGNPETGPFFIDTAFPGDTLVVHIVRLRLNRDTAVSDDGIVPRATDPGLAVKLKDTGNDVTWNLDREHGIATTTKPGDHLKKFVVPTKPMLGCIATAPGFGPAIPTQDSGRWGGNMDFNEVVEGNTVFLPVNVPGALLYFGDGHAAQGDGELNGNALETSMEVEITVNVVHGKQPPSPRVESPDTIMAMGLSGSLDDALKVATSNMSEWLEKDYQLSPSEIAQVLGTSADYHISEVADRNAGIVLKLKKQALAVIQPGPPPSAK
jgi:amidase